MTESAFIGLICGATTGTIYAIVNPDADRELDNPRWLLIQVGTMKEPVPTAEVAREPLMLLRMPRARYMACTQHDQVQAFAMQTYRTATKWA